MSLETLSVAANVFQVVSFADAVIRAGTQLYELFTKARAAAQNIANLLAELQALLRVVANVHVLLSEQAASTLSSVDAYSLQTIRTILTLIEHDFRHLKSVIATLVPVQQHTWYARLTSGLRWAVNEREVETACHRLSRYTTNLTAALSVSGRYAVHATLSHSLRGSKDRIRRNDLVLKAEIHKIRLRLDTIPMLQTSAPDAQNMLVARHKKIYIPVPQSKVVVQMPRTQRARRLERIPIKAQASVGSSTACAIQPQAEPMMYEAPLTRISMYENPDRTLIMQASKPHLLDVAKPLLGISEQLIDALSAQSQVFLTASNLQHLKAVLDLLRITCHGVLAEDIARCYDSDRAELTSRPPTQTCAGLLTIKAPKICMSSGSSRDFNLVHRGWTLTSAAGNVSGEVVQLVQHESPYETHIAAFRLSIRSMSTYSATGVTVQYASQALKSYMSCLPYHTIMDTEILVEDEYGKVAGWSW